VLLSHFLALPHLKNKISFKVLNNYLMSNLTHGYNSYGTKKNTQVQILKIINGQVLGTKVEQKQL
jgi:hypothetical protein